MVNASYFAVIVNAIFAVMVNALISVDPKSLPWEQATPLHNRWHPGKSL
jgi:hypothetical protein